LSKRLAEHAAWQFVAENKCFELATICPSFVLGPVLSPRVDAESVKFMKRLIDGSMLEVGGAAFGVVDVRNVAQAHVGAMTVDLEAPGLRNTHGEARFILSSEVTYPLIEVRHGFV
jgi:nucleoside-diphosphate-sugar epimerase